MLGKVGLAIAGLTCLAAFETLRQPDPAAPAAAEAVEIIAGEAGVSPSEVENVQCTLRASAVYARIALCRAVIGTADRTVTLTSFDGRWVLAGRSAVTASRTGTPPAIQ